MMMHARDMVGLDDAWNALARRFGQQIQIDGGVLQLDLADMPQGGRQVHMLGDGLRVVLDTFPFAQATQTELIIDDLPNLPPALAETILEGAIELILTKLPYPLPELKPAGLLTDLPQVSDEIWIAATLDIGWSTTVRLLLGGTRKVLARTARRLPDLPAGQLSANAAEAVQITFQRSIGALTLRVAQLADLQTGDILVPNTGPCLENARTRIALRPSDDGWTPQEIMMTDDMPVNDVPTPDAASEDVQPLANLDDLPVRLSLMIGSEQMTLAELRNLSVEALIPLSDEADQPGAAIRILANGKLWGTGELVDIEGQPAVRVCDITTKA